MSLKARLLPALALLPLISVTPAARADFNLSFSMKFEPMRYTLPQYPTGHPENGASVADVATAPGSATLPSPSVNAFQRQNFSGLIGLGFTDKLTVTLGVDFARASLGHTDSDPAVSSNRSFNTFGITAGVKWNFIAPRREKISPYVYGDFFKYFTAINDERPSGTPLPEVEFAASLAAPLGFRLAFGIEYYFTDSFAIGAEIFGLEGAFSSATLRRGNPVVTHEQSLNSIAFYTALTLTFRMPHLVRYGSSRRRYRDRDERE